MMSSALKILWFTLLTGRGLLIQTEAITEIQNATLKSNDIIELNDRSIDFQEKNTNYTVNPEWNSTLVNESNITDNLEEVVSKENELMATFSKDEIEEFKENYGIKSDATINIQAVVSKNEFRVHGKEYSLGGIRPINIFKKGATYMHNDVVKELPFINVYVKEELNEILLVSKETDGYVNRITIIDKDTSKTTEVTSVRRGIYATIEDEHIDFETLNEKYEYGHHETVKESIFEKLNDYFHFKDRTLEIEKVERENEACQEFNIIELAIAYESSFCSQLGGTEEASTNEALSIIAAVSQKYEQSPLCSKIVLTHLEGYCDSSIDPYRAGLNTGLSGCSCGPGLLNAFGQYWKQSRTTVERDVAHLLTGKSFDCQSGPFGYDRSCKVGCAWVRSFCTHASFGINDVTFTNNANLRAVLLAHELGHNINAGHTSSGYIMNSVIQSATNGFSSESIDKMLARMEETDCTDKCASGSCCVADSDCDNGLFCDGEEICLNYECTSVNPPCDDGDVCTADSCHEGPQSCSHIPIPGCCNNDSDCDNGIFCDGKEICMDNACVAGEPETCDDGDICTFDICDESTDACANTFITDCQPSAEPSWTPSSVPSSRPSFSSMSPSEMPSEIPSSTPSIVPSEIPSQSPSSLPTAACVTDDDCDNGIFCDGIELCIDGSCEYNEFLRCEDFNECTFDVCYEIFEQCVHPLKHLCYPSAFPSPAPSIQPSAMPSIYVTASNVPSMEPSPISSESPSFHPSEFPSSKPSLLPTSIPSDFPSSKPSLLPTSIPSDAPTLQTSSQPTVATSNNPTVFPTLLPS